MQPEDILNGIRDVMTVRRVFGEPYERDGALVVPVARVRGGGGGASGSLGHPETGPRGWGGGLGVDARPVGVYVIREGRVSWEPAVDVTAIALGGQMLAIAVLMLVGRRARRRRRAARRVAAAGG